MASYQARQRDPLFDSNTQAVLAARGRELVGIALTITGLIFALIISSYSPDDPSWFSATDAPVNNLLGQAGAAVASPLYIIAGWGGWGIAAILIAWGVRFITHRGDGRATRTLFLKLSALALEIVDLAVTHESDATIMTVQGLRASF